MNWFQLFAVKAILDGLIIVAMIGVLVIVLTALNWWHSRKE